MFTPYHSCHHKPGMTQLSQKSVVVKHIRSVRAPCGGMSVGPRMLTLRTPLFLFLALTLTGCLPSSCKRTESRALFPADSLSRELAAALPVDTLRVAGSISTPDLVHPRTVGFAADGTLWMTDTGTGSVYRVESSEKDTAGVGAPGERVLRELRRRTDTFPYLAGFAADTALVFEPSSHTMWRIAPDGDTVDVALGGRLPERGGLRYAAANDSVWAIKIAADGFDSYLARLDPRTGEAVESVGLTGEAWRHAGLLRVEGDTIRSLSAYLPQMHVWVGALDSLRLTGFDSPMLARTRQFVQGDTHEPPMLSASAAFQPRGIHVLNMRPGWLRIDIYDRAGHLQYILTQPDPGFNKNYYPTDLAVREYPDGRVEYAVSVLEPEPRIDFFTWQYP